MAAQNAWSGFGNQKATKCNSQLGVLMRKFVFLFTVTVSMVVLGGCASSYVLSPDNLAAQLRAGQKGESAELATTISAQVPNRAIAGSVERLLCSNQSGEPIWVYPNENTELHVTKRTGEMVTIYFDTVLLQGTKLKGLSSRIQKTEQEVDLSDIQRIEVYTVSSKTEPAHPH
jgi:hypothetical protein